jgi:hypothetical protein
MVNLSGKLAGLIKKVKFEVVGVEDESSENAQVIRVEMAEEMEATGSNTLPNGGAMKYKSSTIFVGPDDIQAFEDGLTTEGEGEDQKTFYEGALKLTYPSPEHEQ